MDKPVDAFPAIYKGYRCSAIALYPCTITPFAFTSTLIPVAPPVKIMDPIGVDVRGPENDEDFRIGVLARSIGKCLHISAILRIDDFK